jgi:hypothetical protein
MERSKESWLKVGAGDLKEAVVQDVPVKGESVKVRGLPAAYSRQASSEAVRTEFVGNQQVSRFDMGRLEVLQFVHGVIDPQFTLGEAEQIAKTHGPAWQKVIDKIDELSGLDKEAIAAAEERFPAGGGSQNGPPVDDAAAARDSGPDLPARAG